MSAGVVIVFEMRPRWVPELERQFDGEGVRIQAWRSLGDLSRSLFNATERVEMPGRAVAIIDISAGLAESLQFLGRFKMYGPSWPVIAIGSTQTSDLEWSVRELGVLEWLLDTVSGDELARLCRRQFQSAQTDAR